MADRYVASLYFAMTVLTTVGFGDVTPYTGEACFEVKHVQRVASINQRGPSVIAFMK